jgi:putative phosphoesterase
MTGTLAIIADIHGNLTALEAVLKDLHQQKEVSSILVLGDLFAYGPAPREVLATLQQLPQAIFIIGNTDRYLLEESYPIKAGGQSWQAQLLQSFHWTREQIQAGGLHFLAGLPVTYTLKTEHGHLLAVHGSPQSDEDGLTATLTATELQAMALSPQVTMLAGGHTHIPIDRVIDGVRVVNVGSVGLPFDGDPRACYALVSQLNSSRHALQVEMRRVAYDIEQVVDQLYAVGFPAADITAYNLRTAHSRGSELIYTPEMRQQAST